MKPTIEDAVVNAGGSDLQKTQKNMSYVVRLDRVSYRFLFHAMMIVGMGGLIFGYDIAVISGGLGKIEDEFNLNSVETGLVVSFIYIGAVFGCLWGGPLADRIGRWKTIHVQNFVFIIGAMVIAFAQNTTYLYIGRFLVGVASALSGISEVPYLLEISPSELRGPITTTYEISVCVGVLVSFILGLAVNGVQDGWRILFGIPAALAAIQSLCLFALPESPLWLSSAKHDSVAADAALDIICDSHDNNKYPWVRSMLEASLASQDENNRIRLSKEDDGSVGLTGVVSNNAQQQPYSDSELLYPRDSTSDAEKPLSFSVSVDAVKGMMQFAYPLMLVVLLQILIQLAGGVVIRNYSPILFERSGFSSTNALLINVFLGLLKLLISIFSAGFMERSGRLYLLTLSSVLGGIGMAVALSGFWAAAIDRSVSSGNMSNSIPLALFLVGTFIITGGYSCGFGSVPWVISAELFPAPIRGWAMSLSLLASNASQGLTNLAFLPLIDITSPQFVLGMFGVLNIVTLLFVKLWLVEPRDLSPYVILSGLRRTPGARAACFCCTRK